MSHDVVIFLKYCPMTVDKRNAKATLIDFTKKSRLAANGQFEPRCLKIMQPYI